MKSTEHSTKQSPEVKNKLGEIMLAQLGAGILGSAVQGSLVKSSKIPGETKQTGDYLMNFAEQNNVKVYPKVQKKMFQPAPPYYVPKGNFIALSSTANDNSQLLAHELGHSINHTKYKNLAYSRLSGNLLSALAGMVATSDFTDDAIKEDRVLLPTLGLTAVAAAGQVPTLYDEAMASKRGLQLLKDSKTMSPEQILKASKSLKKLFGTYAISAGLVTAGPAMAIGMKKYFYDKENKI